MNDTTIKKITLIVDMIIPFHEAIMSEIIRSCLAEKPSRALDS